MRQRTLTITSRGVNCYLVESGDDYFLIDTGYSSERDFIEKHVMSAGCQPGNLKLIIITHGDRDHTGNCAFFRDRYKAKVVMHHGDSGMAEHGDILYNRKGGFLRSLIAKVVLYAIRAGGFETFTPDIWVEDVLNLSQYGLEASIIHIPGHSKGSIGVLTAEGNLFCGDLLANRKKPAKGPLLDNMSDFRESVYKLGQLEIKTVYPGHGKPFQMEALRL
jgi:hydroxyacylglutathione hydrolase